MRELYVDYLAGTILLPENLTTAEARELIADVQAVLDVAARAWCHDQVRHELDEVQQHRTELAGHRLSIVCLLGRVGLGDLTSDPGCRHMPELVCAIGVQVIHADDGQQVQACLVERALGSHLFIHIRVSSGCESGIGVPVHRVVGVRD